MAPRPALTGTWIVTSVCLSLLLTVLLAQASTELVVQASVDISSSAPELWIPFDHGQIWIVTSNYGEDLHTGPDHYAVDFARACGDTCGRAVRSTASGPYNGRGRVIQVVNTCQPGDTGSGCGYGNFVKIDHGNGFVSLYAHLQSVAVQRDQEVCRGQVIGYVGNTGTVFSKTCNNCRGGHLHFAVHHNGNAYKPEPLRGKQLYWNLQRDAKMKVTSTTVTSCDVDDLQPPSLREPADGSTRSSRTVTFRWDLSPSSGVDVYILRVVDDPNKIDSGPWLFDGGVDAPQTELTVTLPKDGNFWWAVWACRGCKTGNPVGRRPDNPWYFRVSPDQPPLPPPPPAGDWQIRYFNDLNLSGDECHQGAFSGSYVFQDWGDDSPGGSCNRDFSARAWRRVRFEGGHYTFYLFADDNARLLVRGAPGGDLVVNQWSPSTAHIEGRNLPAGEYEVVVEYNDTGGRAVLGAWWTGPGFPALPQENADPNQWYAQYWGNRHRWENSVFRRNEGDVLPLQRDWGMGGPGYGLPDDRFSARFERMHTFDCGLYRFEIDADDWAEFVLGADTNPPLLKFGVHGRRQTELDIPAGSYKVKVDYYEEGGYARLYVNWTLLSACEQVIVDAAEHVRDITVPDGTVLPPNQSFVKTWRMRNTGTTTWGSGYHLVFLRGDQMRAPTVVSVPSVAPNQEVNISASMVAPGSPGVYTGYWRLRNPQGVYFA